MANSNHCIFFYLKNCESNSSDNNAICTNSSENFLDSVDVSGNNNNINYDINTKHTNYFYYKINWKNNVECENLLKTQVNSLSLSGDNTPIDLDINTKQSNDCDDKTNNDSNLNCMNLQHRIETPWQLSFDNRVVNWLLFLFWNISLTW